MQTTLRGSDKLKGVQIADAVVLPEKVELTGDLVIIANTLVFEGSHPVIQGVGKNVYIFPIAEAFPIGKTFETELRQQNISTDLLPEKGQRIAEKYTFKDKARGGSITIKVNGQGPTEWRKTRERRDTQNSLNPENVCPPICNGNEGAPGNIGDPGFFSGNYPPESSNGFPAMCGSRASGGDGDPGADVPIVGPDNAGRGKQGNQGGTGGYIMLDLLPPFLSLYHFEAMGGQGGDGGPGGKGAPGDSAQAGGSGGDGADCPCNRGGPGNGGNGQKGGRGGKGGVGGRGGIGGPGGPGGTIILRAPAGFDWSQSHVQIFINGGSPGIKGEGGFGGEPGLSGAPGNPGRGANNSNCASQEAGHNGLPGAPSPPNQGTGERGSQGENGTFTGPSGSYNHSTIPGTVAGGCNGPISPGQYPSGCASGLVAVGGICTNSPAFMSQCNRFGGYDPDSCGCFGMCDPNIGGCSPVVVDVLGNGFTMTSAANGVMFDLQGNGTAQRFSWIAAGSDDSWLALDRNSNGTIDSGRELFGNVTSQPPPPEGEEMNGFLALAQYDTAAFGGNSDSKINQQDAIFSRLRLWQDENHNGVSESCELKTLPEVGLRKIDLDYRDSNRVDEFGNEFRYKAKVKDAQDAQLGRWAWDVFLVLQH